MKDYESMSDFEINACVECELDEYVKNMEFNKDTGEFSWHHPEGEFGGSFKPDDFCSNPACAWQIIFENGISLIKQEGEIETMACVNPVAGDGFSIYSDFEFYDKNPLRAAMIVFLMMKEKNQ